MQSAKVLVTCVPYQGSAYHSNLVTVLTVLLFAAGVTCAQGTQRNAQLHTSTAYVRGLTRQNGLFICKALQITETLHYIRFLFI